MSKSIYLKEFKTMVKKSLKVPKAIAPLLKLAEDDIKHTLEYYYQKSLEVAKSQMAKSMMKTEEPKKKLTAETMNRLYPPRVKTTEEQKRDTMIFNSIEKFSERLIDCFFKKHKAWTNDKMILYDYWKSLSEQDRVI